MTLSLKKFFTKALLLKSHDPNMCGFGDDKQQLVNI